MDIFINLGLALGLGFIIGLQRESVDKHVGIRSFPLIGLLGALTAELSGVHGPWLFGPAALALAAVILVPMAAEARRRDGAIGLTTEVAALLMFLIGVAVASGFRTVGLAVGGTVALLLQWKGPLHAFVERVGHDELKAIFRLVLVALVILPVLPNEAYGPYDVLNPFQIWLVIALISGISLGGYLLYKALGAKLGTVLGGLLGGLISSTATTVSSARQSAERPETSGMAATVVLMASAVAFARVLAQVAAVAPGVVAGVFPPLLAMFAFMTVLAAVAFFTTNRQSLDAGPEDPPTDLRGAIAFGVLYAVVLFLTAAMRDYLGTGGLYAIAVIAGLPDINAITLSTARLAAAGSVDTGAAWRAILLAALANLVFKGGVVAVLGAGRMSRRVLLFFAVALAGGAALFFLWP